MHNPGIRRSAINPRLRREATFFKFMVGKVRKSAAFFTERIQNDCKTEKK